MPLYIPLPHLQNYFKFVVRKKKEERREGKGEKERVGERNEESLIKIYAPGEFGSICLLLAGASGVEAGEVGGMAKQEEISLISDSGDVVRTRECSFCGATTIAMAATSGECDKRRLLPCVKEIWTSKQRICFLFFFLSTSIESNQCSPLERGRSSCRKSMLSGRRALTY